MTALAAALIAGVFSLGAVSPIFEEIRDDTGALVADPGGINHAAAPNG